MKKIILTIFVFSVVGNIALRAQEIFSLDYSEWPDGCLTYQYNLHYQFNVSTNRREHRNDTAYVRGQINQFNNLVRQYNAVQYRQGQHNAGDYVYDITTSSGYSDGEACTSYSCSIFRVGGSSGSYNTSSGGSYDGLVNLFSLIASDLFYIGYNYTLEMPIGLTIGLFGFYTSWNLTLPTADDIAEERFIDWAFTAGYSFNLIGNVLRLPVGIGMNRSYEYL
jgi:hypothetical protein